MAPNWTRLFHVACCCCILAASLVLADQFDTRRQVSRPKGQQAPANNRPVSATSMAMAPANDDELEEDRARPKAEMRPDGSGESTDKEEPMSQDDEQPARGDPESRRPAKRPMDRSRHENEDEDCYDGEDYADYGSHFFEPMRHFSNMMDSVFQQMSGYGKCKSFEFVSMFRATTHSNLNSHLLISQA